MTLTPYPLVANVRKYARVTYGSLFSLKKGKKSTIKKKPGKKLKKKKVPSPTCII
jgi:hypothetical protein